MFDPSAGYHFPGQNVETVVGNGRLIARARAGSADFIFAGPAARLRLLADGQPVDERSVDTLALPGRTAYTVPERGTVVHAAQPDALLYVLCVQADGEAPETTWTLELEGRGVRASGDTLVSPEGRAAAWNAPAEAEVATGDAHDAAETHARLTLRLAPGARAAFVLGSADAVDAFAGTDPFEAADAWEAGYRARGLRLRTPDAALNRAVDFLKVHMQLGYDWRPEGQEGGKMVCDIFRWRDVWSRDFGSGFGMGALAADMYDAVLATLDYEAARYAAHPPEGLKVSDDASQGGSAESLGWLMKLVWRVFKHTGDRDWLRRMLGAFEPWMELWISRDTDDDGLVVDVTEWMDHSRFLRLTEGQRTLYSNVLYYAALRRFYHLYRHLGDDARAERYRDLSNQTRTAIHDAFWNEAGYFNNAVQWGVPDEALMLADNALAVNERIASRNERFRTLDAIRARAWRAHGTVTTDLPMRYVGHDNDHNGKVWPWWMAHEARARFVNFDAEGGMHVLRQILATLERDTLPGLCEEYLNPDDGSQDDVVGHAFITGSGAALEAIAYGMLGLGHIEPGETALRLAPVVPREWESWSAEMALYRGTLSIEQSPEGYRLVLDGTRVERLELRIPPREAVRLVTLDGAEIEPERLEEGASEYLRFTLAPSGRHVLEIDVARGGAWAGEFARPDALPDALACRRPLLMDEPRLFADILQGFVVNAVSYFGQMRHVAAREIGQIEGPGDLLVVVGNELPLRTRQGDAVPGMIDALVARGGSLLLLGPRFPRIDITQHYHGGAQMGGHAGMFWWKHWEGGRWRDVDPRTGESLPAPEHRGTVYWGEGPLFAAWEHGLGLFGFETDCRGVYDVEGHAVDPDQRVEIVYSDWAVRRPWRFYPLAFTEREQQLVTGPRRERYPAAAVLCNDDTGARVIVVAPALCSRADLLHRILGHVVRPAGMQSAT